jgi:CRISPR-associated exonuclease Cas4
VVLGTWRDIRLRLRFTTPALLLAEAIERLRIRAVVAGRSADQAAQSLANVDGLLERARNYGVRGFVQFARDLDNDWSTGTGFAEGIVEADGRSIEIVTVHSSKGLEWPVVIPINRASMPRPPEPFVYRRNDEKPALGARTGNPADAGWCAAGREPREARREPAAALHGLHPRHGNARHSQLLLVRRTSWAQQLDLRLDDIPELDVSKLRRAVVAPPMMTENRQSAEVSTHFGPQIAKSSSGRNANKGHFRVASVLHGADCTGRNPLYWT